MNQREIPELSPCLWKQDLDLASRARAGMRDAVEEFLARMGCVRRFQVQKNQQFGRPLGQHELEDLIQETLFAVWQKLGEYNGSGSLEAWAYRFSYLRLLTRIRKLDRLPPLLADLNEHPPEPVAPIQEGLRYERLYSTLERIASRDRDLIRMKVFEQNTFEELALKLGLPCATLKTRFYRALEKLRGLLQAHEEDCVASSGGPS